MLSHIQRHRFHTLLFMAAFIVLSVPALSAQETGRLEGTITNSRGEAIAGAMIFVKTTNRGVVTSQKGLYRMEGLPARRHTIEVMSQGKVSAVREVTINVNAVTVLNVMLEDDVASKAVRIATAAEVVHRANGSVRWLRQLGPDDLFLNTTTRRNPDATQSASAEESLRPLKMMSEPVEFDNEWNTATDSLPLVTGALTGRIVDESGEGIPGATILVRGTDRGAAADMDGNFLIQELPIGSYIIQILSVGMQSIVMAVEIAPYMPRWLEVILDVEEEPTGVFISCGLLRSGGVDPQTTGKITELGPEDF